MANCLRCGKKDVVPIHTCKATKMWSNGFERGQQATIVGIRRMIVTDGIKYTSALDEILNKMEREE